MGLALATSVQTTTPQIEKNEYIQAIENSTKILVTEIVRDDYAFIAEKLEGLEKYNWTACEMTIPQTIQLWKTKLMTASYDCKVEWNTKTTFYAWQTIGEEKKISKNETCKDVWLYFWNQIWQLQFWNWAWVKTKTKKWYEDIIYTNITCAQLAKEKGVKNLK